MLTRGVKFQFKSGENVLCFEPDSSKARVLYEAKVLDTLDSREKRDRRKPSYLIHFQGWNSSWDRVVPESYLLKNNEDNRRLMTKLSSISNKIKHNGLRLRKIDKALRKHFRCPSGASDDPTCVRSVSSASDIEGEENEEGEDYLADGKESGTGREDQSSSSDDDTSTFSDEDGDARRTVDKEEETSSDEMPAEDVNTEPVQLELTEQLKRRLENDYDLIKNERSLLRLPASPSVITVLEMYVRTFAVSVLCANVAKQKSHLLRSQQVQKPEKSTELCKEIVDGLRLIFDFTLPLTLLYDCERSQYTHAMTLYTAQLKEKVDEVSFRQPPSSEISDTPQAEHQTKPQPGSSGRSRMSSAGSQRELRTKRQSFGAASGMNSSSIRAASPSQAAGSGSRSNKQSSGQQVEEPKFPVPSKDTKSSRRRSTRGESRETAATTQSDSSINIPPERRSMAESWGGTEGPGSDSRPRIYSVSSVASVSSIATSSSVLRKEHEALKATSMSDILTWKLLPDSTMTGDGEGFSGLGGGVPVQPSAVYGAHHLLRLFVQLPDLITRMMIPVTPQADVVKHLEMFIQYLDRNCDELFPLTAYTSAEEAMSTKVNPSSQKL